MKIAPHPVSNPFHGDKTGVLLAAMMGFLPAVGARSEELLQDTLKSILLVFFVLTACLVLFWELRTTRVILRLHGLIWLPIALATYAAGSMVWSHTYLGAVEAVRWIIFSLILFLGMQTWTPTRVTYLAWGIHVGAVIASLWAALQYWFDFQYFAQGPNPASTFVNRNFFAEYVVCTIPFSVLLLTRLQDKTAVFLTLFSLALNVTAIAMASSRSALIALVLLMVLLPVVVYKFRRHIHSKGWREKHAIGLAAFFVVSVLCIGSIPSGNATLRSEFGDMSPISRALDRTASIATKHEYSHGSFSIRLVMWRATARMIKANPIVGVGAGAWEVEIPLYQTADSQLETDYYAHNEFLQLVAEYGLVGWLVSLLLFSYLAQSAYRIAKTSTEASTSETLLQTLVLMSLLVLFVVSNAGFPLRLAATGAIFAIGLSILAATDLQTERTVLPNISLKQWKPAYSIGAILITTLFSFLAVFVAHQAIECETKLVRAIKIALQISLSRKPNDGYWNNAKTELLNLTRQGIAINPHYRKLTPGVADSLARWGDWKNAIWIWESVHASRPNVVAITANIARGHIMRGEFELAQKYLDHAKSIRPNSPSLASLEIMLWSRSGKELAALQRCKVLLAAGFIDSDLLQNAYYLGKRLGDTQLTIHALELGIKTWPDRAVDGLLKLGAIYASPEVNDQRKAMERYQAALDAAPLEFRAAVAAQIPEKFRP